MPAPSSPPRPGVLRSGGAAAAAVLLGVGLAVAPSAPALAAAGCTTTTPALGAAMSCTTAGSDNIDIPSGATHVRLKVTGAGGGGSRAVEAWASGGKGAVISGWAELPMATDYLTVVVGAGGAAGVAGADNTLGGGGGGGGSGVFAYDASNVLLGALVIAGGGGGAGGRDVTSMLTGEGGDADADGAGFSGSGLDAGGGSAGGAMGVGGAGGAGDVPGTAGSSSAPGTVAAGGAGASITTQRGGGGGGGFGGGGGGAAQNLVAAGSAGTVGVLSDQHLAGGGGGGSSYIDTTALLLSFSGLAGSTGAGSGGSGLSASSLATLADGAAGAVELKFAEGKAPPTITSVSPSVGPLIGGGTVTMTGTDLEGSIYASLGSNECTSVVVLSDTQLTCTVPANVAGAVSASVASLNGTSILPNAYTYTVSPTVVSVSPTSGPLSGGGTLTVTGTSLLGTSAVSVGGTACTSIAVVSATQVTCTLPGSITAGAVNVTVTTPSGSHTLTGPYTYLAAPTVLSISPTSGWTTGGGTLTITGTNLAGTSAVMLLETECTSIVNVSPTQVTCTIPPGTVGTVSVSLTTLGGFHTLAAAYTYVLPTSSTITPTTAPTTPPTTAPTTAPTPTPTETPEPTPSAAPRLQLTLDLEVNSPVVGAQAVLTGGGLRSSSQYVLTMRSTPVQVASGTTDVAGNFKAQIKLPGKVCVAGGLHELVLTGIAPDGTALRDSSWIVLDDNCTTRSLRKAKPVNNTVTLGSFIFPYLSARLTPHSKSVLRNLRTSMRTGKRVTITGYTQTTRKSPAAKKFNRGLAVRRAAAVRKYLRSLGVRAPITIVGAGGIKPLKGKAQKYNRRVVITVRY